MQYISSWLLLECMRSIWIQTNRMYLLNSKVNIFLKHQEKIKSNFISDLYLDIQLAVFIVYFSIMG